MSTELIEATVEALKEINQTLKRIETAVGVTETNTDAVVQGLGYLAQMADEKFDQIYTCAKSTLEVVANELLVPVVDESPPKELTPGQEHAKRVMFETDPMMAEEYRALDADTLARIFNKIAAHYDLQHNPLENDEF